MNRRHDPTPTDDAGSLSAIVVGGTLSLLATAAAIVVFARPPEPVVTVPIGEFGSHGDGLAELRIFPSPPPEAGADRIWGGVILTDGRVASGYLRWNDREASWADLLPATAPGGRALAGVRFGHLTRLERRGADGAMAVFKDGRSRLLTPGGRVARALPGGGAPTVTVENGLGETSTYEWREIDRIHFSQDSREVAPVAERIHGTVTVANGRTFSGYVLWNGQEGVLSDRAGDEIPGDGGSVPFADVVEIRRSAPDRVAIEGRDGARLERTVEALRVGLGEITVADPALGSVAVPWSEFRSLRLGPADVPTDYHAFDGGRDLVGTVRTKDGRTFRGRVAWDADERRTTSSLDGMDGRIRYSVEFGLIRSIESHRQGARVTLRDGRRLYLAGTNDVNWANRGIRVEDPSGPVVISWRSFERLDFNEIDAPPGG